MRVALLDGRPIGEARAAADAALYVAKLTGRNRVVAATTKKETSATQGR